MSDRKHLVSTIWLAFSLAMLALVMVSPDRAVRFVSNSPRLDGPRPNFALTPGQNTTRLVAAKETDPSLEVNDLPSENEEQDPFDALDEPRISFLSPDSFRKVPDRQSIATRSVPSLYPLRC